MTIRMTCAAAAVAFLSLASLAQAAVYEFTCKTKHCVGDLGSSELFLAEGGPDLTVWAGSSGLLNDGLATLTRNGNGLGVNGRPDLNPGQIDGFPLFSSEFVTFSFAQAVNLLSISFLNVDRNDQFDYAVNGGDFVTNVTIGSSNPFALLQDQVRTLVIRASGTPLVDGLGNDDFSIARLEAVAAVPLPAGGVLLLSGLGAIALATRRRRRR